MRLSIFKWIFGGFFLLMLLFVCAFAIFTIYHYPQAWPEAAIVSVFFIPLSGYVAVAIYLIPNTEKLKQKHDVKALTRVLVPHRPALYSPHLNSQRLSVMALTELGDPEAIEGLVRVLYQPYPKGMPFMKWLQLRESVAQALGKLGFQGAAEPLIAMLQEKDIPPSVPKTSRLAAAIELKRSRLTAAEALGQLGNKQAVESVVDLILEDQSVEEWALIAQLLKSIDEVGFVESIAKRIEVSAKLGNAYAMECLETFTYLRHELAADPLSAFSKKKVIAHARALTWWEASSGKTWALCDSCNRQISKNEGYLCEPSIGIGSANFDGTSLKINSLAIVGTADLICASCFSRGSYEPFGSGDTDLVRLRKQLQSDSKEPPEK